MKFDFAKIEEVVKQVKINMDTYTYVAQNYETSMIEILQLSRHYQDSMAWLLYYGKKCGINIRVDDIESYPEWQSFQ
jgi:hypothetical protein